MSAKTKFKITLKKKPVNPVNFFLSEAEFLAHFPRVNINIDDFKKKFIVTYRKRPNLEELFDLDSDKTVIKSKEDKRFIDQEKIIKYFYDVVIVDRHKHLARFYQKYFGLPDFYKLKWDNVDIYTEIDSNFSPSEFIMAQNVWQKQQNSSSQKEITDQFNKLIEQPLSGISLQKNDNSRRIIRNLNYLDILHRTKVTNSVKARVSFWQSLLNVYNHLVLEDRMFAPSSLGLFLRPKKIKGKLTNDIDYNTFYYLFQQYQPKASILNSYTINWILKNLFSGTRLLTPVLSWSSYMLAFMHSDWEHYVGIDVMPSVCQRTQFLFDHYQTKLKPELVKLGDNKSKKEVDRLNKKSIDLYCQPSESLLNDKVYMTKYKDYFDAILFCPPYFDMEIYPEGDQSTLQYPTYDEWLIKYWEATVKMCHHVLKPGKKMGFIINNYESLKKDSYPLIQDLNVIALKYFKLVGAFNLLNRTSPLRVNYKKRTEMLFIYEK